MCIAASRSIEQSVRLKEEETKTKKSAWNRGREEGRAGRGVGRESRENREGCGKREQGGEWGRESREGSEEGRIGRGVRKREQGGEWGRESREEREQGGE